jgi:hypothetical protein
VIFDDVNFSIRPYDLGLAYGQSKTANVLFAVDATHRWSRDGITASAVHPGTIAATNLLRHLDDDVSAALAASAPYAKTYDESRVTLKTVEQGAATSVFAATSPQLDGRYFEDCNEGVVLDPTAPKYHHLRRCQVRTRPVRREPALGTVTGSTRSQALGPGWDEPIPR